MNKIFKALSIGMSVLSGIADAISEESEGGEEITQTEFVRIAVRSGVAALKAFGKEIVNSDDADILAIMKEELELAGIIGQ